MKRKIGRVLLGRKDFRRWMHASADMYRRAKVLRQRSRDRRRSILDRVRLWLLYRERLRHAELCRENARIIAKGRHLWVSELSGAVFSTYGYEVPGVHQ